MIVNYYFTEKERQLILLLREMGNLFNYSSKFDQFRKDYDKQISEFIDNGLIEHVPGGCGSWITKRVSNKGLKIFKDIKNLK